MYKYLFNHIKKIIPKISETEIIALKSGGTNIDREIFNGKINYTKLYQPIKKYNIPKYIDESIDELLDKTGPNSVYPSKYIR